MPTKKPLRHLLLAAVLLTNTISIAQAWESSDLTVYKQATELRFPSGFQVVDDASPSANVVKTVSGPADATVSAYVDSRGARFYMSDWSYDRYRSEGIRPNWIRGDAANSDSSNKASPAATGSTAVKSSDYKKAFIVGVKSYDSARQLRNATNDAVLMATTLKDMGFQIHGGKALLDPSADDLAGEFLEFVSGLAGKSEVVIYFAGHGIQAGGDNLLLPRDFELPEGLSDAQALRMAKAQCLNLSRMLSSLDRTGASVSVVFLDCCRDTGFLQAGAGLIADGTLADPAVTTGDLLVGFAAKHGQKALDGKGDNSPFATSLAKRIKVPGSSLGKVLSDVTSEVVAESDRKQQPFFYGSLTREVFLAGEPAGFEGSGGALIGKAKTIEALVAQIENGKSRADIHALMGEPKRARAIDKDIQFESYQTEGYAMQFFYNRADETLIGFTVHLYRGAVPIYRGRPENLLFVLGKSSTRDIWTENGGKPKSTYNFGIGSRWIGSVVSQYYWGRKGHYNYWLISAQVTEWEDDDDVTIDPDAAVHSLGIVGDSKYCEFIASYVGTPISESEGL